MRIHPHGQVFRRREETGRLRRVSPTRLRADAGLGLLAADLVVLWVALRSAREATLPMWFRTACLVVAVVALALTVRSSVSLVHVHLKRRD